MRYLGLDVGDRWIGVALSDPSARIASPLTIIKRIDDTTVMQAINRIIGENEVGRIIVGLPRMLDGSIGIQAEKVQNFAESLRKAVDVPVILWDERLTTAMADKILIEANVRRRKRKRVVDKVAAAIILQGYLDSRSEEHET